LQISIGNHGAQLRANGQPCPTVLLPLHLAHFPDRSFEQTSLKYILACYTLTMKRNRLPGEGTHVYRTLNDLCSAIFTQECPLLRELALRQH
jgi:hypothetical protein